MIPNGGLTVYPVTLSFAIVYCFLMVCRYYFGRAGTGAQQFPDYKPFPRGFRMIAGNAFRRSLTLGSMADQAITFVWYVSTSMIVPY